jgi:protein-disulfide isomerase
MSRNLLLGLCVAAMAFCQAPARKKAGAPKAQEFPLIRKSALDKPTLEAYLRHFLRWFPPVKVEVSDPKPSNRLPGFLEITARASYGGASQEEVLVVSKDGRKILRGTVHDIEQNPFKAELEKLNTQLQPSMGTPGAPVVLVLFTDFQCPYCKEEAKMLRQNLLATYPKQVRLYFKDLPLEQLHPWAKPAAMAGRCVFRQNAALFWDYHDWIYENQEKMTPETLKNRVLEWAKDKELDVLQLSRCIETKATEAEVNKSMADARALKVYSTPTMFINGRAVVGNVSWPELKQIIDYEIEYQKTARNAGEDCECSVELPVPGRGARPASGGKPLGSN